MWFLPFNQGWNDGAGNPPNPNGLKTDYMQKFLRPGRQSKAFLRAYGFLADHTELFKQFSDNESFRRWLSETVFTATYEAG